MRTEFGGTYEGRRYAKSGYVARTHKFKISWFIPYGEGWWVNMKGGN